MDKFKISAKDAGSALLDTMMEVYAQNEMIIEGLVKIYSNQSGKSETEIRDGLLKRFFTAKNELRDYLFVNHGSTSIDDLLNDQK